MNTLIPLPIKLFAITLIALSLSSCGSSSDNPVSNTAAVFNAATDNATCVITDSTPQTLTVTTRATGTQDFAGTVAAGLVSMTCTNGTYTDEATGQDTNSPMLRAGINHPGGALIIVATPLSEVAYQLAASAGDVSASTITAQNALVANAFGLTDTNIISTIPTDLNTTPAGTDAAGIVGVVLAGISQLSKDAGTSASPTMTITTLVNDLMGSNVLDVDLLTAITDLSNNTDAAITAATNVGSGATNTITNGIATGSAVNAIEAYNNDNTGTAPDTATYTAAGISGVTTANLAAVNRAISAADPGATDTVAEIQALIDDAIAPDGSAPAPTTLGPTNLSAVANGTPNEVTISWEAVDGAASYTLYQTIENLSGFENSDPANLPASAASPTTHTATIAGSPTMAIASPTATVALTPATTYYFLVTATTDGEESLTNPTQTVAVGFPLPFGIVDGGTTSTPTGTTWMDRNLGARQLPTASTNTFGYGDLYQWGRAADGHQIRTSNTTTATISLTAPLTVSERFVIGSTDWATGDDDYALRNAFLGLTDGTGICPTGFRAPTTTELEAERLSWSPRTAAGAFASNLKWPAAGSRSNVDGSEANLSYFLGRVVVGDVSNSNGLLVAGGTSNRSQINRAVGYNVRCIRD